MTAEFESIAEMLLVLLAITCIMQLVFVGLLLWYVKRMAESLGIARQPAPQAPAPSPPAVAAEAPMAPVAPVAGKPEPVPALGEAPAVELFEGSPDIQGSIQRLCQKYDLSDLIITTLDGLVVVSLSPGSSEEAARFSDLYRRRKKPDSPGVTFLEIVHRGEAMLLIARSDHPLSAVQAKEIEEDARKILHWWL
jgi:hypothetical protein